MLKMDKLIFEIDLPIDYTFADNLCGYCTGIRGKNTTDYWLNKYFEELNIDPKAKPEIKTDYLGRQKLVYPNPGQKWVRSEMPCGILPSSKFGFNGKNYADLENKVTLDGQLLLPEEFKLYNQLAYTSVIIMLIKPIAEEELFLTLIKARANKFCNLYGNYKIISIRDS